MHDGYISRDLALHLLEYRVDGGGPVVVFLGRDVVARRTAFATSADAFPPAAAFLSLALAVTIADLRVPSCDGWRFA